jgi:predicted  nucleic acid-binding Zn-ribbon protein
VWVRTIREDNFGPERGEAINTELENLRAAKDDIDKSISAMRDLWEEINKTLDAFVVRHNDLSNEAKKSREAATAMMIKIDYFTRK